MFLNPHSPCATSGRVALQAQFLAHFTQAFAQFGGAQFGPDPARQWRGAFDMQFRTLDNLAAKIEIVVLELRIADRLGFACQQGPAGGGASEIDCLVGQL